MTQQTSLPFNFEVGKDKASFHADLALFGEFCIGLGVNDWIDRYLPMPGSGAGYKASEYIFPLILMLNSNGRSLEDIRIIRNCTGLRKILPLKRVPSADRIGEWLRKVGNAGGLSGLERVNRKLIKRYMKYVNMNKYTLDIEATVIEAEKESAKITYKGFKGYIPALGCLAENGLLIGDEFREGDVQPGEGNLEFIKHCIKQLPEGKRIGRFRADRASYQADIINFCKRENIGFAIGCYLDEPVLSVIHSIPDSGWSFYKDGSIANTTHSINTAEEAFRLIVERRPYQKMMFEKENIEVKYNVIATDIKGAAIKILRWYDLCNKSIGKRINDLKVDFGMERMPCGKSYANAVFFRIGVLAYNIYRLFFIKTLDSSWHKYEALTVRKRLHQSIIGHGQPDLL